MKVFSQIHVHTKHFFIIRNAKTNKIFVKINFIFHVEKLTNTTICSTSFKFIFIKCDKLLFMITVYLLVWGTFIKQIFFSNNVMVCNILYCIHQKIKKKSELELNLVENIDK